MVGGVERVVAERQVGAVAHGAARAACGTPTAAGAATRSIPTERSVANSLAAVADTLDDAPRVLPRPAARLEHPVAGLELQQVDELRPRRVLVGAERLPQPPDAAVVVLRAAVVLRLELGVGRHQRGRVHELGHALADRVGVAARACEPTGVDRRAGDVRDQPLAAGRAALDLQRAGPHDVAPASARCIAARYPWPLR